MVRKLIWIKTLYQARKQAVKCLVLDSVRKYDTNKWNDSGYWVCDTDKEGEPVVFEYEYVENNELDFSVSGALEKAKRWKNPVVVFFNDNGRIFAVGRRFRTDLEQVIIKRKGGELVYDSWDRL